MTIDEIKQLQKVVRKEYTRDDNTQDFNILLDAIPGILRKLGKQDDKLRSMEARIKLLEGGE